MPANKSALARYYVIDDILGSRILAPERKTAEAIVEALRERIGIGVSVSMFHKDIAHMRQEFGAPIAYDRANRCYSYTQADFSIKGIALSDEEKRALDISPVFLEQLIRTPLYGQFKSAIEKVIRGYRMAEIIGKSEKQVIQIEEPTAGPGDHWVEKILYSILEGKKALKIGYAPYGKTERLHYFSPYMLKEYRNRWYTVGRSEPYDTVLVLALDRIRSLEESDKRFRGDPDFRPEEYFRHSMGITQLGEDGPEKIEIRFTSDQAYYLESQPWHHSQRFLREERGQKVYGFEMFISHELIMAILACGDTARVLKPRKLVQRIKERIRLMARNYR